MTDDTLLVRLDIKNAYESFDYYNLKHFNEDINNYIKNRIFYLGKTYYKLL